MARTKNPLGDPVSIYRKRNVWKVRYYPTGFISKPEDRMELSESYDSKAAAEGPAAVLRAALSEHRNAYIPGANDGDTPLSQALARYVRELQDGMASRMIPDGTGKARISDVSRGLSKLCDKREFRVHDLEGDAARSVIAELVGGSGRGGAPKAANTLRKEKVSINNFGTWLLSNGYLEQNPFLFLAAETNEGRFAKKAEQRVRALTRVNQESYSSDGDDDTGIGLDDVPTLDVVSQLGSAIRLVESRSTEVIVLHNKALSPDTAWQTSQQPMLEVATGLRLNETLGLHTSRIELATLTIGVDRQLDPRRPWVVGQTPPLMPPKHNKSRRANIWPVFAENLERLMDQADRHTDGWLFPPTGRQVWRTKARETEWQRAIKFMDALRAAAVAAGVPEDELPARWTWKPHYTRHTYGSYSLAPNVSGGLGWSVLTVKESMGHRSERTTMDIYRHVTSEERDWVRSTLIAWPGLK